MNQRDLGVLVYLIIHMAGLEAIQLLQVSVPSVIQTGEGAILLCDVDMENEVLYSVKWYKDNEEFFRFVPRDSSQFLVYNVEGINVNMTHSSAGRVLLTSVTLASSGHYRCETSAEAPSFSSVSGSGNMEVVSLPRHRPVINGGQSNYRPGDLVDVNCTSAASKPAAQIKWFINDKPAKNAHLRQFKSVTDSDGLEMTVSGLTFTVDEWHLRHQNKLSLRCVASVRLSDVDSQSADPLAASTASFAGGYQRVRSGGADPNDADGPVVESMEVRFEASKSAVQRSVGLVIISTLLHLWLCFTFNNNPLQLLLLS